MIKVAMTSDNGEVAYVVNPAVDDMYTDGQVYNGHTARLISHSSVDKDVLETWYWKNGWQTRVANTLPYYIWVNEEWQLDSDALWVEIRSRRDLELAKCDWTQIGDNQLTETQQTEWTTYRQALRDVPLNNPSVTTLESVAWPTPPA